MTLPEFMIMIQIVGMSFVSIIGAGLVACMFVKPKR